MYLFLCAPPPSPSSPAHAAPGLLVCLIVFKLWGIPLRMDETRKGVHDRLVSTGLFDGNSSSANDELGDEDVSSWVVLSLSRCCVGGYSNYAPTGSLANNAALRDETAHALRRRGDTGANVTYPRFVLRATRVINRGEEICFDYITDSVTAARFADESNNTSLHAAGREVGSEKAKGRKMATFIWHGRDDLTEREKLVVDPEPSNKLKISCFVLEVDELKPARIRKSSTVEQVCSCRRQGARVCRLATYICTYYNS